MKKEIDPPYKPKTKSTTDTSNFDGTFTSEPVVDSMVAPSTLSQTMSEKEDAFGGFTYEPKAAHLGK